MAEQMEKERSAQEEEEQKEGYCIRIEAELGRFSAEADALKTRVERKTEVVSSTVRQELDAIGEKQAAVRREMIRLRSAAGGAWKDVRKGVDLACDDLRSALTRARERFG